MLLAAPAPAAAGWSWPVAGELLTSYRNGTDPYAGGQHRGIDIAADTGTPVVAATAGTVRFAGVAGSSGLTVSVRTADGSYDTSYLHLSSAVVREGAAVSAGDRLGAVGTSGRRSAARPHLHFGVREAGSRHAYVDPVTLLGPPPAPPPQAPRVAPVPVPVPVAPAPRTVRVPRRVRTPAGRRLPRPARRPVPALRRLPRPTGRPLPAPRRVPAGRRLPAPRTGPAPRPVAAPAGNGVPSLGPQAAGTPAQVPASRPAPAAVAGTDGGGRDVGWVVACLGLLLAAALMGRSSVARAQGRRPSRAGAQAPASSIAARCPST